VVGLIGTRLEGKPPHHYIGRCREVRHSSHAAGGLIIMFAKQDLPCSRIHPMPWRPKGTQ
jgi:hypothetical protein